MRLSPALASMIICALLGACATQLDESGAPLESDEPLGGTSGVASNGGSLGKGGAVGKGGTASGGKAGATAGSSGSGSGGTAGASNAGSAGSGESGSGGGGSSASGGSSGSSGGGGSSGSGGTDIGAGGAVSTTCAALPVWMANTEPPNKPMLQGDELTYMNHKFAVAPDGAMIAWWNDVCPPSGARADWCETDAQRYTDLGACE